MSCLSKERKLPGLKERKVGVDVLVVISQDVPINLAALKLRVEELKMNAEVARLQAEGAFSCTARAAKHMVSCCPCICQHVLPCVSTPLETLTIQLIDQGMQLMHCSFLGDRPGAVRSTTSSIGGRCRAGKTERAAALLRKAVERPRLADMQANQALLLAELRRCYGSLGYLPTRKHLREANRCGGPGCTSVGQLTA